MKRTIKTHCEHCGSLYNKPIHDLKLQAGDQVIYKSWKGTNLEHSPITVLEPSKNESGVYYGWRRDVVSEDRIIDNFRINTRDDEFVKVKGPNIAFKIVSVLGNRRCSFSSCGSKHDVTYAPDQWAKPQIPNSKLFAFSSLCGAREYMREIGGEPTQSQYRLPPTCRVLEIWMCHVVTPAPMNQRLAAAHIRQYANLFWNPPPYPMALEADLFWNTPKEKLRTLSAYVEPAPNGTIGTTALKLVRKISPLEKDEPQIAKFAPPTGKTK